MRNLTRLVTLIATVILAAAVCFGLPSDYRLSVSIIVSAAALLLVVQSLSTGRIMGALIFLGIVGVFTPLRSSQFSDTFTSILDLVTLALFAASPVLLRKSAITASAAR